jgi:hypothetical protein
LLISENLERAQLLCSDEDFIHRIMCLLLTRDSNIMKDINYCSYTILANVLIGSNDDTINILYTDYNIIDVLKSDLNSSDMIFQFCASIIFRQIGFYTKNNSEAIIRKLMNEQILDNMTKNFESEVQNKPKNAYDQYMIQQANNQCKHSILIAMNSIVKRITLGKFIFKTIILI